MPVIVEEILTTVMVAGTVVSVAVPPGPPAVLEVDNPAGVVVTEGTPGVVSLASPTATVAVPVERVTLLDVGTQGPQGVTGPVGPQGPPGNGVPVRETPAGTVDGVNAVFTLSAVPVPSSEQLYLNGLLQESPGDYSLGGAVVTFADAPLPGDRVRACYLT